MPAVASSVRVDEKGALVPKADVVGFDPTIAPKLITMTIEQAAHFWLTHRLAHNDIAESTARQYREHLKPLRAFFGDRQLKDIGAMDVYNYQQARAAQAGPSLINHECSMLQQILRIAGFLDEYGHLRNLWGRIEPWYKPLKVGNNTPGRALDTERELYLFRTASIKPMWRTAYCCALITANTTAGPGEIRKLQLQDVEINAVPPVMYVREGAKNIYRVRTIPLNADAEWAMRQLLDRAREKGAVLPDHYLLPHRGNRERPGADPTRPMNGWKKAWYRLRQQCALRYPDMARLRLYDLRHHAITKLLENPNVSFQTVQDIAGHVSKGTTERYSHIRKRFKMAAVAGLSTGIGGMDS